MVLDGPVNNNITLADELETEKIIKNFRIPNVPIIFVIGGQSTIIVVSLQFGI